jgi:DNA-binding XRE family transcriptional regulator
MTLAEYLALAKIPPDKFRDGLDVSREYISMLASGKRKPSLDLANKIARKTQGAVPADSWGTD